MAFKLVVADPKTRKSYQKEVSEGLVGKKIGDKIQGKIAGLEGYELQITGGSDNDGFPMRREVEGSGRKKYLLSGPPGFHPKLSGQRKRKTVRGNTISEDIVQVNAKVVKYGSTPLEKLLAAKKEEKPEEGKEEKPAEEKKEEPPAEKKETQAEEKKPEEAKKEKPAEEAKPEEKKE